MPRKLDSRKIERILQVLAYNFAEPKRYSFIWNAVREKREGSTKHIGTKKTLNLYLYRLREEGRIVRKEESKKKVMYALTEKEQKIWANIKHKYETEIWKRIQEYENTARSTIEKVDGGEVTKDKIDGVVVNAWLFYVARSTDAFNLLVDAKQFVSFVSSALLNDWVMSPFMLSAKVVEACYNKYPTETIKALESLRNMFQKRSLG